MASTKYTSKNLCNKQTKEGKLICSIPNLLLLPGTYYITLILIGVSGIIDKIERAVSFRVDERDVFKTGNFPASGKGFFFMPADWSFGK